MTDQVLGSALITAGLVFDAIGAVLLASVLILSRDQIAERTASYWSSSGDDPESPPVKAALRDRTRGYWGAGLLVFGFALQIAGAWL